MVDNVTGWNEMMDANLIKASFVMYDTAWNGWIVGILFILYEFMLLIKTKNLPLALTTGLMFAGLYLMSEFVKQASATIIVLMLVLEIAAILYLAFFK